MHHQELDAHPLAPKRFVTLAHLQQVEQADYPALQESTGLSTPDLSKIVKDLEERKLVHVTKRRKGRHGQTLVRLTPTGRREFAGLVRALQEVAG
ncbi:transcriptional regulator [Kytococcus sp. Marseille-QA3725]